MTVLSNAHIKNTEKRLQDYLTFIPDLGDFGNSDVSVLKGMFRDNIQPLITIASNRGLSFYNTVVISMKENIKDKNLFRRRCQ